MPDPLRFELQFLFLLSSAEVICEAPNNRLPKFEGKMTWNGESYSLDNDKILLRGCVLRNTQWCYGLVVFSGHETKLMMNCGKSVFKQTNIDRLMNALIIGVSNLITSFFTTNVTSLQSYMKIL